MLRSIRVRLPEESRAHREAIHDLLSAQGCLRPQFPLAVLRKLPGQLRRSEELCLAVVEGPEETVVIDPCLAFPLAMAVDLGSTNVEAWLLDADGGNVIAEAGALNPQSRFSEDILDRVLHSRDRMEELRAPLVETLNELARELCRAAGRHVSDICLLCGAGNTAMMHLLLGVEATALPVVPNTPVFHAPGMLPAGDAGLVLHPEARLYLLPNVGAFVGGDIVADLLAVQLCRKEDVGILVDVGTNAEVVIGNRHWILAGAGAAGPALEGGIVAAAGRAGPGAVDSCRYDTGTRTFVCSVMGGGPPTHFCGSGLIELVGELYRHNHIDGRGRFLEGPLEIFRNDNGVKALEVLPAPAGGARKGLCISEHDLENFITSKAGMYALIQTLLSHTGLSPEEVSRVHVCGDFGTRIPADTAAFLGMVPPLPAASFEGIENATLQGIAELVRDTGLFADIAEILEKTTYMDMNTDPSFMTHFMAARFIPHAGTDT